MERALFSIGTWALPVGSGKIVRNDLKRTLMEKVGKQQTNLLTS